MRKHILPVLLVIAVLLVAAISCKNNPSPTPTPTPTRPATLTAGYYTKYYELTTGKSSTPKGTLYYTSPEGTITTLNFDSEGVTSPDFTTLVAGKDKTCKFSYKGIDCVVTYSVVDKTAVSVVGRYMLCDNKTVTFKEGENDVAVEEYSNWFEFLDDNAHYYQGLEYSTYINTENGETGISLTVVTGKNKKTYKFLPDGNGGLRQKKYASDLFQPLLYTASDKNYYISTEKTSSFSTNHPNKWLIVSFTEPTTSGEYNTGSMNMWFVTDAVYTTNTLNEPTVARIETAIDPASPDIKVSGNHIKMNEFGVAIPQFDLEYTVALEAKTDKNFYLREATKTEGNIVIVSSNEEGYKGYSYVLKPVTP